MSATTKRMQPMEKEVSGRGSVFDLELENLPQELRWREWTGRVEAVLFAKCHAGWPRGSGARGRAGGLNRDAD